MEFPSTFFKLMTPALSFMAEVYLMNGPRRMRGFFLPRAKTLCTG
ncbi:protein of unknown function [Maridesulfovibrio hydrothermalis AM13 = DSM 14728]|uniref:Uncharacterized protein n=1 Tax=Maridesulfovibrio hydrothermalis AM13 = DSM 14728 TaxID=1121451 RepID=L0RED8_9BACT|nr:protein of unknown function [Maridesulfovibrio hydrothermalis AM13 = DSM 14728]